MTQTKEVKKNNPFNTKIRLKYTPFWPFFEKYLKTFLRILVLFLRIQGNVPTLATRGAPGPHNYDGLAPRHPPTSKAVSYL